MLVRSSAPRGAVCSTEPSGDTGGGDDGLVMAPAAAGAATPATAGSAGSPAIEPVPRTPRAVRSISHPLAPDPSNADPQEKAFLGPDPAPRSARPNSRVCR